MTGYGARGVDVCLCRLAVFMMLQGWMVDFGPAGLEMWR